MDLSELYQKKSSPTEDTNRDMLQIFDYLATYPDNGITYCSRDMILADHSDTSYFNLSRSRSHAGAHIMLPEDVLIPLHSGPVLTISKIIKSVISSVSKA